MQARDASDSVAAAPSPPARSPQSIIMRWALKMSAAAVAAALIIKGRLISISDSEAPNEVGPERPSQSTTLMLIGASERAFEIGERRVGDMERVRKHTADLHYVLCH